MTLGMEFFGILTGWMGKNRACQISELGRGRRFSCIKVRFSGLLGRVWSIFHFLLVVGEGQRK